MMDWDGKSVPDRAASDPLDPTRKIAITAAANNFNAVFLPLAFNLVPVDANHAVKVNEPSRMKVLIRWPIAQNGRASVRVSAVFPVKTNPAPINASVIIKMNETAAKILI